MRNITFSILFFLLFSHVGISQNKHQKKLMVAVGTYTGKGSEGIYLLSFDPVKGEAHNVGVVKGIKNPSFLTFNSSTNILYAVSEDQNGMVYSYAYNQKTHQLSPLNQLSTGFESPCHVTLDRTGRLLFVSHYGGGNLTVYKINEDGSIGEKLNSFTYEGNSVNKERQEKSHVHSSIVSPDNKNLFVADLGTDKIYHYTINADSLTIQPKSDIVAAPGSGPRHLTIDSSGKRLFCINELNATVTVYSIDKQVPQLIQTIATLPVDYSGKKWCADIHLAPDNKYLYVSNRAHETVSVFSNQDASKEPLKLTGRTGVMGKTPRNFTIDPSGNFLLVANQDSDNITIFKRDKKSGKITYNKKEVKISLPVCLQFL